ncbi:MAG TPA: D-2-hydroxyacid dehydrogenase [Candidatus Egerieimonas intestinavium]|uniref:D-2-hydroxyacid dehydrogenase n=1 Tax=Candidatus Egerieimonas intestinavium TaxID=2840777 RepID=A0A9D1EIJ0_9FIRM|nr:D-2-hydroxyacid dehydrogenase [Candidatus Egerieimonas intestinavium]
MSERKIVVLDGYTENPGDLSWEGLERLGEVTVYDRTAPGEAAERIGGASLVLTNKTPITREVLESCGNIRYIGVLATGYNVVDVQAARERGIVVTNIPAYGTEAVGQYAIALLLEICSQVGHHSRAVHEGRWESCRDFCFWDYPLIELAGKTMGIVGFGRIGRTVARIAQALGMNILACANHPNPAYENESCRYASLEEVLAQSDVISLHCPLTKETEGLINRDTIGKMKDGVILLNNSRGPLVVEEDLAEALKTGKVYAAGVDVVSTEPIRGDNPLLAAPNCFITPHISWAPRETRQRLMDIAVQNLKSYLEGRPENVVKG